ncbi:CBS domain-containing protein [Salinithrix halophila]|uniref:CBS domain-containing protein n=1 Tax=Salinithrix halophila TaxID=1485204 RepID=A0ABV8JDF1_9BACL
MTTLVKDVMRKETVVCSPSERISTVAFQMAEQGIDYLPVCKDDRLKGVLTPRVIMLSGIVGKTYRKPVKKVMDRRPVTISPDASVEKALRLMERCGDPWLSVVEKGRLTGIVGLGDLAKVEGMGGQTLRIIARSSEPRTIRGGKSHGSMMMAMAFLAVGGWLLWAAKDKGE